MKTKLNKAIKDFCKAHYYVDGDTVWEPFKGFTKTEIKWLIHSDSQFLRAFLVYQGLVKK